MRYMSIHRNKIWLTLLGSLLLPPAIADAQRHPIVPQYNNVTGAMYAHGNAQYSEPRPAENGRWGQPPLVPVQFDMDWQPFAPADISDFGNGIKPNYGYFASYDRLYWWVGQPDRADVGSSQAEGPRLRIGVDGSDQPPFPLIPVVPDPPDPDNPPGFFPNPATFPQQGTIVNERNSLDTSIIKGDPGWGNRYELGYMDTTNHGWLITIIDKVSQNQGIVAEDVQVMFRDPDDVLFGWYDVDFDGIDDDLNGNGYYGRDGFGANGEIEGSIALEPAIPDGSGLENPDGNSAPFIDYGDATETIPRFRVVEIRNKVTLNGIELMRSYRAPQLHDGGFFELLYGVRYFQFLDRFSFEGTGRNIPPEDEIFDEDDLPFVEVEGGGALARTEIFSRWDNNIVGPQIAGRWFNQRGRWQWTLDGRFLAGFNFANADLKYRYGGGPGPDETIDPYYGQPGGNNPFIVPVQARRTLYDNFFSPMGELRLQANYVVTKSFSIKAGYNALVIGNVGRASNRIDYTLPNIRILDEDEGETAFINGLNIGLEFNR